MKMFTHQAQSELVQTDLN